MITGNQVNLCAIVDSYCSSLLIAHEFDIYSLGFSCKKGEILDVQVSVKERNKILEVEWLEKKRKEKRKIRKKM